MRFVCVLLLLSAAAVAQTVTGTLDGRIVDSTGGVIVNAQVTVRSDETGLTRGANTNNEGYFQFAFLPVGPYSVTAQAPGFTSAKSSAIVELNATHSVEFRLKPSAVSEVVTVVADATMLETTTGEIKSKKQLRTGRLPHVIFSL